MIVCRHLMAVTEARRRFGQSPVTTHKGMVWPFGQGAGREVPWNARSGALSG